MYLPIIGLLLFFSDLMVTYLHPVRFLCCSCAILVILLIPKSIRQTTVWKNELSLWEYTVTRAPQNYNTVANYAVVLSDTGEYHNAVVYFKKALELENRPQSHYNLGNTYARLKLREKAKQEYRRSIEIDPNYSEAHNNLAKLLAEGGNYTEAVKEIKLALGLNPYNAQAFNNLGACLNHLNRHEEAVKALTRAIQLRPYYTSALFNIGTSYYKLGDYENAEKSMRLVIAKEPKNRNALKYLQHILEKKKISLFDNDTVTASTVQKKEISRSTEQPAKTDPPPRFDHPILDNIGPKHDIDKILEQGDASMNEGNYHTALPMYRRAIRSSPKNPTTHYKLAQCYVKLGSFKLAHREFLKVQDLSPQYPDLKTRLFEIERIIKTDKK